MANIDSYASGPFLDVVQKVCGRSSLRAALSTLRRHFYKVKINVPLLAKENKRKEHIRLVYDIIEDAGSFEFELNGEITTVEVIDTLTCASRDAHFIDTSSRDTS